MKKIVFSNDASGIDPKSDCIDLRDDNPFKHFQANDKKLYVSASFIPDELINQWKMEFLQWLSHLNARDHGVDWWAHTSTAKNLLSSPLGEKFFQAQVICHLIKKYDKKNIVIIGASQGQKSVITSICDDYQLEKATIAYKDTIIFRSINCFLRLLFQALSVFIGFISSRSLSVEKTIDISIFTYLDSDYNPDIDKYFGSLPEIINSNDKKYSLAYFSYLYTPYRDRIKQIENAKSNTPYIPIFSLLKPVDYIWATTQSVKELLSCALLIKKEFHSNKKYKRLLQEVFLYDISHGGYFHNLLVYKSIQRAFTKYQTKKIIYPFENKSLEKMILLGVSQLVAKPKTIGYQHTSITPRHLTFQLEPSESRYTPLPDKIVTLGDITKQFLIDNANYPKELIHTACALRQKWDKPYARKTEDKQVINILLALSSSKFELIQSLKFFQEIIAENKNITLGIRPHINFTIDLLPQDLALWVKDNAIDLTGTLLEENLKWCDITAYVSSTVALECMMKGKPIINIDIGDYISSDPVLGEPEFYFSAKSPQEFLVYLNQLSQLPDDEYNGKRDMAIRYVEKYFAPVSDQAVLEFT